MGDGEDNKSNTSFFFCQIFFKTENKDTNLQGNFLIYRKVWALPYRELNSKYRVLQS